MVKKDNRSSSVLLLWCRTHTRTHASSCACPHPKPCALNSQTSTLNRYFLIPHARNEASAGGGGSSSSSSSTAAWGSVPPKDEVHPAALQPPAGVAAQGERREAVSAETPAGGGDAGWRSRPLSVVDGRVDARGGAGGKEAGERGGRGGGGGGGGGGLSWAGASSKNGAWPVEAAAAIPAGL